MDWPTAILLSVVFVSVFGFLTVVVVFVKPSAPKREYPPFQAPSWTTIDYKPKSRRQEKWEKALNEDPDPNDPALKQ